jgi:hypothetical protein
MYFPSQGGPSFYRIITVRPLYTVILYLIPYINFLRRKKAFHTYPSRRMPLPFTLKKVIVFPVPSRDVANQALPGRELTKFSLAGNY